MNKQLYKVFVGILLVGLFLLYEAPIVQAKETHYDIIIDDIANLLTEAEENKLRITMEDVAEHGNAIFVTVKKNDMSAEHYAQYYYTSRYNETNGVIFLIDMDNRKIWLCCYGNASKMISDDYTEIITDNVYTYASDEKYFDCANIAFSQIYSRLKGGRISQPMKYICNILFAMSLSLVINFFIMRNLSAAKSPTNAERQKGMYQRFSFLYSHAEFVGTTKTYSPARSSGGGSSGGGSSGGGSSGGHSF